MKRAGLVFIIFQATYLIGVFYGIPLLLKILGLIYEPQSLLRTAFAWNQAFSTIDIIFPIATTSVISWLIFPKRSRLKQTAIVVGISALFCLATNSYMLEAIGTVAIQQARKVNDEDLRGLILQNQTERAVALIKKPGFRPDNAVSVTNRSALSLMACPGLGAYSAARKPMIEAILDLPDLDFRSSAESDSPVGCLIDVGQDDLMLRILKHPKYKPNPRDLGLILRAAKYPSVYKAFQIRPEFADMMNQKFLSSGWNTAPMDFALTNKDELVALNLLSLSKFNPNLPLVDASNSFQARLLVSRLCEEKKERHLKALVARKDLRVSTLQFEYCKRLNVDPAVVERLGRVVDDATFKPFRTQEQVMEDARQAQQDAKAPSTESIRQGREQNSPAD